MVECFLVAFLLCDPGIYFKHPFSSLESSTASQTVHVASGLIGQYSPSWCHGVAFPLMPGFAKKLWFQIAKFGPITCLTQFKISGFFAYFKKSRLYFNRVGQ